MKLRIGDPDERHAKEILVITDHEAKRIDRGSAEIIAAMYKWGDIEFHSFINITIRDLMLAGF